MSFVYCCASFDWLGVLVLLAHALFSLIAFKIEEKQKQAAIVTSLTRNMGRSFPMRPPPS